MTLPGPPAMTSDFGQEISRIWQAINEINRKTLYSASISDGGLTVSGSGGIEVRDPEGHQTFFVGGLGGTWTRPDGQPQASVKLADDNGNWRIAVWDPDPSSGEYSQHVFIWDAIGNLVFGTDAAGGLNRPALAIPMYCRYTPPAGSISYVNIPVASLATTQTIWEGRISLALSPRIEISGTWGSAIGTNTTSYTLQVNGQTAGSWTSTGIEASSRKFDISQWLGYSGIPVRLLVQSTGDGNAAAQVNGCNQCGS